MGDGPWGRNPAFAGMTASEGCRCYNPGLRGRGSQVVKAHRTRRGANLLAAALLAAVAVTLIGCDRLGDRETTPAVPPPPPSAVSDGSLDRIRLQPIVNSIRVGTTVDSRARTCSDPCSLREAIRSAEPGTVIDVPAGVYVLEYGGLLVDRDLTIIGAGPDETLLRAVPRTQDESVSVIMVPGHRVQISGMTIEGGRATWGGGIYNQGDLTIADLVVRGNEAEIHGGGIFNLMGGTLVVSRTLVTGNVARHGGGIFNDATITVTDSTVVGNSAIRGKGGGLHNSQGGVVALSSTSISGNSSRFGGGGIYTRSELTLINAVVMDNQAGSDGGGIFNWGARLRITNSTVAHNRAPSEGGGVHNIASGMMTVGNSIIASNESKVGPDCFTSVDDAMSMGHNLVGNGVACDVRSHSGDMMGTTDRPIDPNIRVIRDGEGRATQYVLLEGSPAIDAADDGMAPGADSRGTARPQGGASDIGAYEKSPGE